MDVMAFQVTDREIISPNLSMCKRYFPIGNIRVLGQWIGHIFTEREILVCIVQIDTHSHHTVTHTRRGQVI